MTHRLGAEDYAEIVQVASLLMHVVDNKQLDRLNEIFTEDGVYDGRNTNTGKMAEGVGAITELWSSLRMGVHMSSDLVVVEVDESRESVMTLSKWWHTPDSNKMNMGVYHDQWTKTPAGWRIRHRVNNMVKPSSDKQ